MHEPDRKKISKEFQDFIDGLKSDQSILRQALEDLAVTGAGEKNPQEAQQIIYKASMVELLIKLSWLMIKQAEYCDYYIDKNEGCHNAHLESLKKIRETIKPFTDIKRDFLGIANINGLLKKSPVKFIEWGALLAVAKYLHLIDVAPK